LQYVLRVRSILQSSITSLFLLLIFEAGAYSLLLQRYNQQKETDLRLSYARKLVNERDNVTEYLLGEVRAPILSDQTVRAFFEHPNGNAQRLTDWLDRRYFDDGFNRFDVTYHFYDCDGVPLEPGDAATALGTKDLIGNSEVCGEHELYFLNEPAGSFTYIAEYPIKNTGEAVIGTLMVQLTSKIYKAVNVYPELLLEEKNKLPASDYAYAIYTNNELSEHAGAFTYPAYNTFTTDSLRRSAVDHAVFNRDDYSHLVFGRDENKTVVVSLPLQQSSRLLSYFSYMFLVLFLGMMLIWFVFFVGAWWSDPAPVRFLSNASFRTFIQFSFFLIILLSVVVIGLFTGRFFVNQFNRNTEARLNEKLQMVAESSEFLYRSGADTGKVAASSAVRLLRENVANLSSIQDIDINYYSLGGDLITTSQPAIFERGLISRKINPRALYLLSNQSMSHMVLRERIGALAYLSGYQPLRTKDGRALAYLNLPFFNTTRDLNEQIGLFFASLITILVFALIVAGLLAPLISRHITRRLSIITDKFKQVTLGRKNEAIEWHTRDELGSLVEEFNKMIYKLEQSAGLLARSERESAWREMAKQVAHEIKNPLTPMKLSIQHLQRAYRNNATNKEELTEKMSATLIEQIDNLSHIANEFSNFAKMPSPQMELVSLDEVMRASVNLYKENESVDIAFDGCPGRPCVNADRGQLLRVFNNLLLNAIQAIPEERRGAIEVRCDSGERFVRVSVSDNGKGITTEEAERLFVPNFTTKSSGTGLGLAISKNIVEGFGGKVWFESVPGEGTTFYVELPRVK
jgi:two-component system, NtrC family, nitrogen regulation sensor histidine kinase NtrY